MMMSELKKVIEFFFLGSKSFSSDTYHISLSPFLVLRTEENQLNESSKEIQFSTNCFDYCLTINERTLNLITLNIIKENEAD